MKTLIMILFFSPTFNVYSSSFDVLFKKPSKRKKEVKKTPNIDQKPRIIVRKPPKKPGNLPNSYYVASNYGNFMHSLGPTYKAKFNDIPSGTELLGTVYDWIIASPSSEGIVTMVVNFGSFKGAVLQGESFFNKNGECLKIRFNKFVYKNKEYKFLAHGLNGIGHSCLKGKYYSREKGFFAGSFIANFFAGFTDSSIPERTDSNGNYIRDRSFVSNVKGGAVAALSETSKQLGEKFKNAPEWIEIPGPMKMKVVVLSRPQEI